MRPRGINHGAELAREAGVRKSFARSRLAHMGWIRWLLFAGFFLWLAFILSSYYLVQNAFLQPTLDGLKQVEIWLPRSFSVANLLGALVDIAAALWIAAAALGLGLLVLDRWFPPEFPAADQLLFSWGIGFGLLGLVVLLSGLVGLLSRPVLLGLVSLCAVLNGRRTAGLLMKLRRPSLPRSVTGLIILASALSLTLALLPPTSWDGLFYHLTGPKLYLQEGAIRPGIDIPHLHFPSLFEMIFLLAMGIRSDVSAVLLHFLFQLLLVGLIYRIARTQAGVREGWPAVGVFYSMPMVLQLSTWAYNDLALAFYQLAALYSLLKWRSDRGRTRGLLFLSGLLAGLAMSLKYTGVFAPLTFVVLIGWWQRREPRRAIGSIARFSGVALLVVLPWLLKNLAFTGNPVYPFLLDGRQWDSFRAAAYAETGTGIAFNPQTCQTGTSDFLVGQHQAGCELDPTYLVRRLVTLPYDLMLGIQDASRDGDSGPLFLVFLPWLVAFFLLRKELRPPPAVGILLFFALLQLSFWTVGVISSAALWQSRLLLSAFAALCPVLAWILRDLEHFDHPRFSLARLMHLVVGLVVVAAIAVGFVNWLPHLPWIYLQGAESREENLRRRLGTHYLAMETINERVPPGSSIVFLWEPRSYYCRRDCRPDSILDTFGHMQHLHGDADSIAREWLNMGIDYVLIFQDGLSFVLQAASSADEPLAGPQALVELRHSHLALEVSVGGGSYTLSRLIP